MFGVATTTAAVHRSLAQDASACVAMEVFQAQPSTHYLNHVIEQVHYVISNDYVAIWINIWLIFQVTVKYYWLH